MSTSLSENTGPRGYGSKRSTQPASAASQYPSHETVHPPEPGARTDICIADSQALLRCIRTNAETRGDTIEENIASSCLVTHLRPALRGESNFHHALVNPLRESSVHFRSAEHLYANIARTRSTAWRETNRAGVATSHRLKPGTSPRLNPWINTRCTRFNISQRRCTQEY